MKNFRMKKLIKDILNLCFEELIRRGRRKA